MGYEGVWSEFRVIREEEMRIEKNEQWREFEESRLFGRNRSHWRKNRGSIQKENLIIILFPTPLFACSSETRPPAMSISLIKSLTSVCTRNTLSMTVPCCIRCFSDTPVKKAAKSTVKPPSSRKIARDNRKKLLQQEIEQYKKLDEIALKSGFPAPWKYYAAAYESLTIVWLIFCRIIDREPQVLPPLEDWQQKMQDIWEERYNANAKKVEPFLNMVF